MFRNLRIDELPTSSNGGGEKKREYPACTVVVSVAFQTRFARGLTWLPLLNAR